MLDLDMLTESYNRMLIERLRGFGFDEDFLGLWVPDEDPLRNLVSLLEAAASHGLAELAVAVSADYRRKLDEPLLMAALAPLGTARFEATPTGMTCHVTFARTDNPSRRTGAVTRGEVAAFRETIARDDSCYQAFLDAAGPLRHNTPLPAAAPLAAREDGVSLTVTLTDGRIAAAAHDGATGAEARILDQLCETILGMPLQEAAEHGLMRAELTMRAPFLRPVPGIVTPFSLAAMFHRPHRLIRALFDTWRAAVPAGANDWDQPPAPAWMAAAEAARRATLAEALASFHFPGLTTGAVAVVAIEWDVRIVLSLDASCAPLDRRKMLMRLEDHIRRCVDPRLEVFVEELRDDNKLRHRDQE